MVTVAVRPRRHTDTAPTVSPLPYGLWSVVQEVDDQDPHWRLGVQFQPDLCDIASSTVADCPLPEEDDSPEFGKQPTGRLATVGSNPFTVYAWMDCPPQGGFWEEARARAAAALTQGEMRELERVFWTGQVTHPDETVYPHLAADAAVFDPDPAVDPNALSVQIQQAAVVPQAGPMDAVEALAVLEQALAECYPGVGVIHMTRGAAIHLAAYGLLVRQGPLLRTLLGTLVAAGGGYPGTAPDGTTPAYPASWMYATGSIQARRSDIFMSTREEALDRGANRMVQIAERTYSLAWDCCLFAAEVHLGGHGGGVPNSPNSL